MPSNASKLPAGIPPDTGCIISPRCLTCPIRGGCIEELPPAVAAQAAAGLKLVQLQQLHGIATDQAAALIGMHRASAYAALTTALELLAA